MTAEPVDTGRPGVPAVPAVGGTRTVPAPDRIAADYIRLGLRLDQHIPGLVDGYYGPADLKAEVDLEQRRRPAALRDDALALRARLAGEVEAPARRAWLDAQLVALAAQAAALAGEPLPYEEHVARCMGFAPPRRADAEFSAARATIEGLLPGGGPLHERLDAWDAGLEIPVERLPAVIDWLVERFRARAEATFGLPTGEQLRVRLVTGQPWSGYNWYDGGRRSRVAVNTDLPVRAPDLVHTVAHETYPGHHLEHAWKEADLVDVQGHLEASILLINTPECPISEGLADLGTRFATPPDEAVGQLEELFERAGLPFASDPTTRRSIAERAAALAPARRAMAAIRGTAAFLRHADGWSHDAVVEYLRDVGGYTTALAAKRLEFIEHPLWRTYVFVYAEGEALLARWLEAVPEMDRAARFDRLLHEQVTPASVLADTASDR
ncbi:MAG: DUF885 domain-containing protein [Candidatus Limnocylindria bacterium]